MEEKGKKPNKMRIAPAAPSALFLPLFSRKIELLVEFTKKKQIILPIRDFLWVDFLTLLAGAEYNDRNCQRF
jgi:hypothetical protein